MTPTALTQWNMKGNVHKSMTCIILEVSFVTSSKMRASARHRVLCVFHHTTVNYYNDCRGHGGTWYAILTPNKTKRKCEIKVIKKAGTDPPSCYVIRIPMFLSKFHLSHSLPSLLCSFILIFSRRPNFAWDEKHVNKKLWAPTSLYERLVYLDYALVGYKAM
jgi:hypothetical protein